MKVNFILLLHSDHETSDLHLSKGHEFFVYDGLVFSHSTVAYHRSQGVDNNPQRHETRDIGMVVWRTDLDNLHATQALLRNFSH